MTAVVMPDSRPAARPGRRPLGQAATLCIGMLRSGLVAAHVGLGIALVVGLALHGPLGLANAAVAGALVLAFLASGQGIQLVAGELSGGTGLAVVLVSYLVRVAVLGLLLQLAMGHQARLEPVLVRSAFFVGATATLVGWLAGVLWRSAHQRVHAYDSDFAAGRAGVGEADVRGVDDTRSEAL